MIKLVTPPLPYKGGESLRLLLADDGSTPNPSSGGGVRGGADSV